MSDKALVASPLSNVFTMFLAQLRYPRLAPSGSDSGRLKAVPKLLGGKITGNKSDQSTDQQGTSGGK